MDKDIFLQKFGHLAQGPDGVKKLRDLILQLAVQGKLVEQDPDDEPASVLLEKIKLEKKRLVEAGIVKKSKLMTKTEEISLPFNLPRGWEWVLLDEITSKVTDGDHQTPPRIVKGELLLSAKNVRNGHLDFDNCDYISNEDYMKSRERCLPEHQDLLIVSVGGTIGRSSLVPEKANFALVRSVALIKPLMINSTYMKHSMDSPYLQNSIHTNKRGGAQPCLYLSEIKKFPFALPPLFEQNRIVAKVDELMALCDELEATQDTHKALKRDSVSSTLHHLTEAAEAPEFKANWSILHNNFNTWFNDLETLNTLRASILQLAVQGKLVEQNPNDEPANILAMELKRTAEELINNKVIKRVKGVPKPTVEELGYNIPENWKLGRMQDYFDVRDGTHDSPKYVDIGIPLVTSKDFKGGEISFLNTKKITIEDHEQIKKRSGVQAGDILFSMIGGNLGNMAKVPDETEFSIKNVALFKYYSDQLSNKKFLWYFLKYVVLGLQEKAIGGAQPFVSLGFLRQLAFPLPPLTEQKCIVAKVDELMAMCDQLETQIKSSQTLNQDLMASLSHHMTTADRA